MRRSNDINFTTTNGTSAYTACRYHCQNTPLLKWEQHSLVLHSPHCMNLVQIITIPTFNISFNITAKDLLALIMVLTCFSKLKLPSTGTLGYLIILEGVISTCQCLKLNSFTFLWSLWKMIVCHFEAKFNRPTYTHHSILLHHLFWFQRPDSQVYRNQAQFVCICHEFTSSTISVLRTSS